ncbi:D-threo-aldose 1-dehydrogenase [Arthrobacter sp. PvP102]|uniref:aldo/keto reductase n=1 Tax=unclassified Arthrobacter TaxID=235627 RepID=UPI001AEA05FC|nr:MULTISPECIES: aldo/keto reductase [unclassified Arthrobacter]MBP1232997.1 D-threo-aldose 1-dehydrogenase [Arthrobacter sp. PvP103]MBP1238132.1 D-threo-aldose 1-dehydrogenase [Arthrobacter sp. PvP102]
MHANLKQKRTIPGTDVQLPVLGFGAAPIGNLYREVPEQQALDAVTAAWEGGIRYFDTAPHYGLGLSERRIGAALAGRERSDYVLSTKVGRLLRPNTAPAGRDSEGFDVPDNLARVRDYSRDGVLRSIEESLQRLRTDRLDIVYIHDPDDYWEEALEGAVPTLSALRDEGIIGAWGAGMNQAEMLHRFVAETDIDVIMLAGRYTLLEQGAARDLLPACLERGVAVVNVGVFNSGLLSKNRPVPGATYNYEAASRELLDRANRLARICESHGTTLPTAALAYPYQHPAVSSVVLGMRTPEQVTQNLDLAAQSVPPALWDELRETGLIT